MEHSVSIKEVIETLSQIFFHHGFSKVTAEVFRKAKFNKSDVATPLFNLIFEILSHQTALELSVSHRFYLLVFILKEVGYARLSRFTEVADERSLSSRELLLALGFLIVKLNIFVKLRQETTNDLAQSIIDTAKIKSDPNNLTKKLSTEDELNELIVLRKKIDFAFRGLYASINWYEKILKRFNVNEDVILKELNENSQKLTFKHISLIDILIQSNLKLQKKLIQVLQKQDVLLKLHSKWLRNEHVFWKWMSSVAHEALSSDNVDAPTMLDKTLSDKLHLYLLFLDKLSFKGIRKQYCGIACDDYSVNDLVGFSLNNFLCDTMSKRSILTDEKTESSNISVIEEITNLQTRQRLVEEDCRSWMSKYLSCNFPNLVQLPPPRR